MHLFLQEMFENILFKIDVFSASRISDLHSKMLHISKSVFYELVFISLYIKMRFKQENLHFSHDFQSLYLNFIIYAKSLLNLG